jgi:hypothetical protein
LVTAAVWQLAIGKEPENECAKHDWEHVQRSEVSTRRPLGWYTRFDWCGLAEGSMCSIGTKAPARVNSTAVVACLVCLAPAEPGAQATTLERP